MTKTLLAAVLLVAGVLVLASIIRLAAWSGVPGDPLGVLGSLFANATTLTRLMIVIVGFCAMAGLALGLIALLGQPSADLRLMLTILSLAPAAAGLLSAAFGLLIVRQAAAESNTTNLMVVAPGIAEALAPFGLGLLAGLFAAVPNAVLAKRGVPENPAAQA